MLVIEHIIDPYSAVKNLHNALNDNGILVLTVPNGRRDTINEHINFWSPESWCGFLSHMFPDAVIKTEVINNDLFNFGIIYR
jgi:2-polyprenyl-3-methyl-5-hydroxy-6-metoxy-1,4-benzoquinol methylase